MSARKRGLLELRHAARDVKASSGARWWFVVIASNGQVLATSEMYTRRNSAVAGMRAARDVVGGDVMTFWDVRRGRWCSLGRRDERPDIGGGF